MNEQPEYAEISEAEMRDLEAEFGHPLTRETALWLIRMRTNRAAVQRMIGEEVGGEQHPPDKRAHGKQARGKRAA